LLYPAAWDAGTSKLQIIRELLGAINFYEPWFDTTGNFTTMHQFSLQSRTPTATYQTCTDGVILSEPVNIETDTDRFANEIIVICTNPDLPAPIYWRETNENINDPISVPNLGRTISKVYEMSILRDLQEAQTRAKILLSEASNIYLRGGLSTRVDPQRAGKIHEVYALQIYRDPAEPYVDGDWWCTDWEMELKPGGRMTHTVGKVQSVLEW
jgi:hypothetical protein